MTVWRSSQARCSLRLYGVPQASTPVRQRGSATSPTHLGLRDLDADDPDPLLDSSPSNANQSLHSARRTKQLQPCMQSRRSSPHRAAGRASALLPTDSTPNRRWPQIADIDTYERPADISANGPDQASEQVIEGECQTQARQPQQRSELAPQRARACSRCCCSRLLMG